MPWSILDYSEDKDGYVVPFGEAELKKAPTYDLDDLTKNDGQALDRDERITTGPIRRRDQRSGSKIWRESRPGGSGAVGHRRDDTRKHRDVEQFGDLTFE